MVFRACFHMCWFSLLLSCGFQVGDRIDKTITLPQRALIDVKNNDASQEHSSGDSKSGGASIAIKLAQREALSGLETVLSELPFVAKAGPNKTIFSVTSGGAYTYDEVSEVVQFLPSPFGDSDVIGKRFLVAERVGWILTESTAKYFYSPSQVSSTMRVLEVQLGLQKPALVHASPERLILKSDGLLILVSKLKDDQLQVETLQGIPELAKLLPDVIASGFGPKDTFLWVATSSRIAIFKKGSEGYQMEPQFIDLQMTLPPNAEIEALSIDFDSDMNLSGRVTVVGAGKIYVSGYESISELLSWETDIRPLAEEFCVSCHGANGSGGFSKADEPSSWTGVKRESIIARVVNDKSMPPTYTQAAEKMTDAQRAKIRDWLSPSSTPVKSTKKQSSDSKHDSQPTTMTPTIPTPGAFWSNKVQPVLEQRCSSCHPNYKIFENVYLERNEIVQRIENSSMPPRESVQGQLTQAEKDAVLAYLKNFP